MAEYGTCKSLNSEGTEPYYILYAIIFARAYNDRPTLNRNFRRESIRNKSFKEQ